MLTGRLWSFLLVASLPWSVLRAQAPLSPAPTTPSPDSASASTGRWAIGGSIAFVGYGGESTDDIFALGVHWTQLRQHTPGFEISLGTMPQLLMQGVINGAARVNGGLPLTVTRAVTLFPSVGVSGAGGTTIGDALGDRAGGVGINGGLTVFVGNHGTSAFRTSLTFHHFRGARGALWLLEIGAVRLPHSRQEK